MHKINLGYKIWTLIIIFLLTGFLFNAASAASLYYAGFSLLQDSYQTLLFALIYLISTIFYSLNNTFFNEYLIKKYINKKVVYNLGFVVHKMNNMSIQNYQHNIQSGEYLSSIGQNFYSPFYGIVLHIYYLADLLLILFLNLAFFFFFNWILGVIALLGILILFIPGLFTYPKWEQFQQKINQETNNWFEQMSQLFRLFNFYYAHNKTNKIIHKTQAKLQQLQQSEKKNKLLDITYGWLVGLIMTIIEISYYLVSGLSLIHAPNSANQIIGLSFFSITNLPHLLSKIRPLPDIFLNLWVEKNIYTKFWKFSDGDQYPENQLVKYSQPFSLIKVRSLNFSYPNKADLFQGLNLTIHKNKKYLLLGKNGSGKSTLTKLLTGMERNYAGHILLNNQMEVKQLKQASLSHYFNLVSNTNLLLDDSLRNNLTLYQKDISDDQIKASLKVMNLSELNQLDHVYQQGKNGLSVGQVQRLDIARCVLNPKPILVLDEALSNVDVFNQEKILNYFLSQKDLTFILITHHLKPDWQAKFDQVIQL